ncbi:hypothetical protein [Tenacibaculum sp. nBUS_03]|uniref:hypothetical protein n=1 Tax=Tenacibaculum sp. nBUS_03 TaxID=3395320 RepID=UPI003EC126CA
MSFLKATEIVYEDLSGFTPLTDLLSNNESSVYPLVAPMQEGENFITYHIRFVVVEAKNNLKGFEVVIRSFSTKYDDCCAIADSVVEALKDSESFYSQGGGESVQTDEGWLFIEQKFSLKIN